MATLKKILAYLQGKKSTIFTILALIITYSLSKGLIGDDEAILFNSILVALGFSANYATNKLVSKK